MVKNIIILLFVALIAFFGTLHLITPQEPTCKEDAALVQDALACMQNNSCFMNFEEFQVGKRAFERLANCPAIEVVPSAEKSPVDSGYPST